MKELSEKLATEVCEGFKVKLLQVAHKRLWAAIARDPKLLEIEEE